MTNEAAMYMKKKKTGKVSENERDLLPNSLPFL